MLTVDIDDDTTNARNDYKVYFIISFDLSLVPFSVPQ